MSQRQPPTKPTPARAPRGRRAARTNVFPVLLFLATFSLYAATAAPATLFGDPSEYQFIPAIGGIAHPPGYAFYTLLARLWQMAVPVATIAFRTNVLAGAMGAWTVTAIYLTVYTLQTRLSTPRQAPLIPAFAALCLAAAPDFWQHAIHANAHIVSAALTTTHLWLLIRWWHTGRDRWLAAFALTLGWAITHHPITLIGIPAYGLFFLAVRPRFLRQWRKLLLPAGCLILGLAPLLYYPLQSPTAPFGPTNMDTWEGFVGHITAQGLRVNLFQFGLADLPDRALVFWSLLRLQYRLPVIALIAAGLVWLVRRGPRPALLVGGFLAAHLLFTLNTAQDVMAYLLIPFAALSIAAGVGGLALLSASDLKLPDLRSPSSNRLILVLQLLLLAFPAYQAALNLSQGISLHDFTASEEYVDALYGRFAGRGEGAVLLSDWEHLTPVWVHIYTQEEPLAEEDVKLVYVSTARPWVESVWAHIEEGPIYLSSYRPSVRDEGFRLVPEGPFYRVIAPPVTNISPDRSLDLSVDERIHILGYDLASNGVQAGTPLEVVLYQRVTEPLEEIWMPYTQLGPVEARWTTDSRLLTPHWQPGEVVAERYELPVPFTLPPGEYPLRLGYADLSTGRPALPLSTGDTSVQIETIAVLPNPRAPADQSLTEALANLDNQVVLAGARAATGWRAREGFWEAPLPARRGRPLHVTLTWRAIASPRDSYKVFVHLIDGANQPILAQDHTPLGRACPTYLWFPKWLPGQTLKDPYRLSIPADLPPGDYWLEVGMYGMTSQRRLPVVDLEGNLAGDRVILGPVEVE